METTTNTLVKDMPVYYALCIVKEFLVTCGHHTMQACLGERSQRTAMKPGKGLHLQGHLSPKLCPVVMPS